MSNISSLKIERHVLGGLIKYPAVFFDVDRFISSSDFVSKEHYVIYSTIKDILSSGKKLDKTLLAHQIKNLGVSFKSEVDIFNYIEDISFTQINRNAVIEACKELCKIRIRRIILHQLLHHISKPTCPIEFTNTFLFFRCKNRIKKK